MSFHKLRRKLQKTKRPISEQILESYDEGVLLWDKEREHTPSGSFHVSDLGSCLREVYYKRHIRQVFKVETLKKFWVGVDGGQRMVDAFIKAKSIFGYFYCSSCGVSYPTTNLTICPQCHKPLTYSEIGIRDLSVGGKGLSGKVDLFYDNSKELFVVECKTATTYYKPSKRESVDKYMPKHKHQGNAYLGMLRKHLRYLTTHKKSPIEFVDADNGEIFDPVKLTKRLNLDTYLLFYEDKNTSDTFAHPFTYDPDMFKEDEQKVRNFFSLRSMPAREASTKNCKYCSFAIPCSENLEAKEWLEKNPCLTLRAT